MTLMLCVVKEGCMSFQLDESIGFTVNRTALKLKTEMARRLKPFELSPEQWSVLNRLGEGDGISQKDLADRTFKDAPTTARILDKLEDRGLVRRSDHPDDRRTFLIFITIQGQELRERIVPVALSMNDDAGIGLNANERELLLLLLNRVQENIENKM